MSQAIQDLSFEGTAIRPEVATLAGDLVVPELSLINGSVRPLELAFAVEQAALELSFILMAVFKEAGALSIVHFADLNCYMSDSYLAVLFEVDDVSRPAFNYQLGQLCWQKRYFWQGFNFHFKLIISHG